MTRVVNLFLTMVAAALLFYGASKGYLYFKAQDLFQRVSTQLVPLGELRYGGIATSLSGALVYEEIVFTASGADAVTIDAIAFKTPNIFYLIGALYGTSSMSKLPDELQLRIEGMSADLNGALMARLDRIAAELAPGLSADALLCDRGIAGPAQYRALGYKQIKSDFELGYHRYSDSTLTLDLKMSSPGVAQGVLLFNLDGVRSLELRRMPIERLPRLTKIDMLYEDGGYTARLNRHCARFKGVSVDGYIAAAANQGNGYYLKRWGFAPGAGLRWGYRTFLTNPGRIHIIARPPASFDITHLKRYTPANIPALLEMSVEVNGQAIPDLTINAIATPQASHEAPHKSPAPRAKAWQATNLSSDHGAPSYRPVAPENLNRHIGAKIRITLATGAVREGWLAEVTEEQLEIEQRGYSGSSSMVIGRERVSDVEIFSR